MMLVEQGKTLTPTRCADCGGDLLLVCGILLLDDGLHAPFAVRCNGCGLVAPVSVP